MFLLDLINELQLLGRFMLHLGLGSKMSSQFRVLCIFFFFRYKGTQGVFDEPVQLSPVCSVSGKAGGRVAS